MDAHYLLHIATMLTMELVGGKVDEQYSALNDSNAVRPLVHHVDDMDGAALQFRPMPLSKDCQNLREARLMGHRTSLQMYAKPEPNSAVAAAEAAILKAEAGKV